MGKESRRKQELEELYSSITVLKSHELEVPVGLKQLIKAKEDDYFDLEVVPAIEELLERLMPCDYATFRFEVVRNGELVAVRRLSDNETVVSVQPDNQTINSEKTRTKEKCLENSAQIRPVHDLSLYSLNGGEFHNKIGFVVDLVKAILDYDPDCTFLELKELLPLSSTSNKTIMEVEEWEKKNNDAQKRYYLKEKFRTCDGIEFYVSTQWTKRDFDKKILPTVEKIGFTWKAKKE